MMKNEIKFVPTAPKTYEVRYLENENKQSNLSPAARSKVIQKWGGNYVSERATINNPSYGPGVDSPDCSKWCSHCGKSVTVSSSSASYCPDCGNAFGTVAKKTKAQEQADKNNEVVVKHGGDSSYSTTTNKDGTVTETATYSKK